MADYRSAEFKQRCAVCGELASSECERCAAPACDDHGSPSVLCDKCEDEWRLAEAEAPTKHRGKVLALFTGFAAGAGVAIAAGSLAVAAALIFSSYFAGNWLGHALNARETGPAARQRFVAEGNRHNRLRALYGGNPAKPNRQLPAPPPDHSE